MFPSGIEGKKHVDFSILQIRIRVGGNHRKNQAPSAKFQEPGPALNLLLEFGAWNLLDVGIYLVFILIRRSPAFQYQISSSA